MPCGAASVRRGQRHRGGPCPPGEGATAATEVSGRTPHAATMSTAADLTSRATEAVRNAVDRAAPVARQAWNTALPEADRVARSTWNHVQAMRVGLIGVALVLVVVIAVMSSGTG